MMRRLCLLLTVLPLAGCGFTPPPPAPPAGQPVPVRGKVLLPGGQPLHGGTVQMIPVDTAGPNGTRLFPAMGFPKADGSFEMTSTGKPGEGVAPGRYKVVIGPKEEGEARGSNASLVPKKYQSEQTTPLEVEIKEGDNALKPFELK